MLPSSQTSPGSTTPLPQLSPMQTSPNAEQCLPTGQTKPVEQNSDSERTQLIKTSPTTPNSHSPLATRNISSFPLLVVDRKKSAFSAKVLLIAQPNIALNIRTACLQKVAQCEHSLHDCLCPTASDGFRRRRSQSYATASGGRAR